MCDCWRESSSRVGLLIELMEVTVSDLYCPVVGRSGGFWNNLSVEIVQPRLDDSGVLDVEVELTVVSPPAPLSVPHQSPVLSHQVLGQREPV